MTEVKATTSPKFLSELTPLSPTYLYTIAVSQQFAFGLILSKFRNGIKKYRHFSKKNTVGSLSKEAEESFNEAQQLLLSIFECVAKLDTSKYSQLAAVFPVPPIPPGAPMSKIENFYEFLKQTQTNKKYEPNENFS